MKDIVTGVPEAELMKQKHSRKPNEGRRESRTLLALGTTRRCGTSAAAVFGFSTSCVISEDTTQTVGARSFRVLCEKMGTTAVNTRVNVRPVLNSFRQA